MYVRVYAINVGAGPVLKRIYLLADLLFICGRGLWILQILHKSTLMCVHNANVGLYTYIY